MFSLLPILWALAKIMGWCALLAGPVAARVFGVVPAEERWSHAARGAVAAILATQALAMAGAFDLLSLAATIAAIGIGWARIRYRDVAHAGTHAIMTAHIWAYDVLDARFGRQQAKSRWTRLRASVLAAIRREGLTAPQWVALAGVLGWGVWLRVSAISTYPFAESASELVHIQWAKQLFASHRFVDGFYPDGAHALAVVLHTVTRLDMPVVWKLMAPLELLICGMLVWRGLQRIRPDIQFGPRLFSVVAVVLMSGTWVGGVQDLHTEMLPAQLVGAMLLWWVITIVSILGPKPPTRRQITTVAATAALCGLVHPLATLLGAAAFIGAATSMWLQRGTSLRAVVRLAIPATVVSVAVVGIGAGFSWWLGIATFPNILTELTPTPEGFRPHSVPIIAAALLGAGTVMLLPGSSRKGVGAAGALMAVATLAMLPAQGAPAVIPAAALPNMIPLAGLVGGLAIDHLVAAASRLMLGNVMSRARAADTTAWGLILLAVLIDPPVQATPAQRLHPEAVIEGFEWARQTYDDHTWTVVAHGELSADVLGHGWHMTREVFVQSYDPILYRWDPLEPELAIPTSHVLVFIEKDYADVDHLDPGQLVSRLQTNHETAEWCERYATAHDDIQVVHETDDLVIYDIARSAEAERDALDRAYEAGWRPE